MLIGRDYHHSRNHEWDFGQFEIHKATEGATYIDPKLSVFSERIRLSNGNMLAGVYHFLSDKSQNESQIKHFFNTCLQNRIEGKTIYVLDYEGEYAAKDSDGSKLYEAINMLSDICDWQPFVYMDKSNCKKIMIRKHASWFQKNVCLWIADYSTSDRRVYNGWTAIMRQFTNAEPIGDLNIFYGSKDSWQSIAKLTR